MEDQHVRIPRVKLGNQGPKALKQLPREKVQLATKFGACISKEGEFGVRGDPEYVRECCEASPKRLGVWTLQCQLKILEEKRYIGLSEASADTIRRAHAVPPITALQMEDSLWTRDIEEDILPLCRELGIGIVAYSPSWHWVLCWKGHCGKLAQGNPLVHASKVRGGELGEEQSALYTRLANLATKHGCTHPQLALAWLQGGDIVPIPGTTKLKNLDNNIRSVAVELTQEDMRGITDTVPISEVSGSKDAQMISLNIPGVLQMPPSKK